MTSKMNSGKDPVEFWSKSLVDSILEPQIIDRESLNTKIKVFFQSALYDCLKMQVNNSEVEMTKLRQKLAVNGLNGLPQKEIELQLSKLKSEKKLQSRALSVAENNLKLIKMIEFLREHNPSLLEQFYRKFDEFRVTKP